MAARRMLAISVVCSDAFRGLPAIAQALYVQLVLAADDDGFIDSTVSVMRAIRCTRKHLHTLAEHGFILLFPSGIALDANWPLNNKVPKDRYHPTIHVAERAQVTVSDTNRYVLLGDPCIQSGTNTDTEVSQNQVKPCNAIPEKAMPAAEQSIDRPTLPEVIDYAEELGSDVDPALFYDHFQNNGWTDRNGCPVKNWKAVFRSWGS